MLKGATCREKGGGDEEMEIERLSGQLLVCPWLSFKLTKDERERERHANLFEIQIYSELKLSKLQN